MDVQEYSVLLRAGYNWFPWGRSLYVSPQLGLQLPIYRTPTPEVAGETYDQFPPVVPIAGLHLGYEF